MPHPFLVETFRTLRSFHELSAALPQRGESVIVSGLTGSSPILLVGALHSARPERIWLVVAPGPEAADQAMADFEAIVGDGRAFLYPQRESLPYEEGETHLEIGGLRVEALDALLAGRAAVLVTTARAMQELAPAVQGLADLRLELRAGQEIRPAELARRLEEMGLARVGTVEEVGQFALRGGILDIFGFGSPEPARLEFWGDQIESIRHFDILSQLSVRSVEDLHILPVDLRPASAVAAPAPETHTSIADADAPRRSLLDYLPPDAVLIHLQETDAPAEWERTWSELRRLHESELRQRRHVEPPERLFLSSADYHRHVTRFPQLLLGER
ncbi:MAG: hypothetical protein M3418_07185, partial [Gemmatimonadota bacterium]|nr:hypothetical protein [Gemmatimonadota bacterium]